jgi:hypothetical protein
LAHVQQVWSSDRGWIWLLRHNAVLGDAPISLLARGQIDPVRRLLVQIEHGIGA